MTLVWLGAAVMMIAALLRMGLGALARMDRAGEAQAAAEGHPRAQRHNRILGWDRWMVVAGWRMEGAFTILAVILLTAGLSLNGQGGWSAAAVTVVTTLLVRTVAGWAGRHWHGAERMSGLVELSARFHSRLWRPPLLFDTDAADSAEQDISEEKEMISSVLEFSDTIVREVMVPRTDMVTVTVDAELDELAGIVKEFGFSRFPVLDGGIDRVVGMALAKDLISILVEGGNGATVKDIQRTPLYVPETKAVSDLLREMRRNGDHMAVVIDEHGGTAGLVTIEDLLEELVGEIVDEHDEHDEWLRAEEGGVWHVDGRYPVDDMGDLLGVTLPQEEWDTVGGLVLALAGRVPEVGETFSTHGVEFGVREVLGHRLAKLRVQRSGEMLGEGMRAVG
ncbi:MAG: hemolysin family protein [bacterium]|nr:hemolysin family protein [Acidimicrobiia bacterium]MCY4650224.1 hemolysin family protein [bacterium]